MAASGGGSPLGKLLTQPGKAWRVGRALFRGWLCLTLHRMRGIRLEAGKDFRLNGRLIVRGPGRVVLGDHVRIGMTVTPWTYHSDAVIEIGSETFVNGTRFGCQQSIRVGPRSILAEAQIMDTDFHSTSRDRHSPGAPVRVAPVVLGENVWVCTQAGILPGTTVGENSVIGFGAIASGSYPANVVIAGNPAKVIRPIAGAESDVTAREAARAAGSGATSHPEA